MDGSNATLDLNSSGIYSLGLFMREDGIRVDKLLLITDTNYIPTGLGPEESQREVVTGTGSSSMSVVQIVTMAYDRLHRLSVADYSGAYTATYGYAYDAVGNRTTYTTTITGTTVITYAYDAANRLLESVEMGSSETTTYTWDNMSRLITTTVEGAVTRVYTYSQDGDMVAALVDGLLTTFEYDGDGHRLRMVVAGEVTTYTLDYAGGFRLLLEEGGGFSGSKHYLYGLACIGEHVDADNPAMEEWRFYQQDGNSLVRQTTNMQATVTLAWTYSPEGAVLLGEEGPVTNLDCSGNTIYDFSTGLIFKNGKYFDPNIGIWTTMSGLVIYQVGWLPYNRKQKWSKDKKRLTLAFILLLLALTLAGCGTSPGPIGNIPTIDPTATPCPPKTIDFPNPESEIADYFVFRDFDPYWETSGATLQWDPGIMLKVADSIEDAILGSPIEPSGYAGSKGFGSIQQWAKSFGDISKSDPIRVVISSGGDFQADWKSTPTGQIAYVKAPESTTSGGRPQTLMHELAHIWGGGINCTGPCDAMAKGVGSGPDGTDFPGHGFYPTPWPLIGPTGTRFDFREDFAESVTAYFYNDTGRPYAVFPHWSDNDPGISGSGFADPALREITYGNIPDEYLLDNDKKQKYIEFLNKIDWFSVTPDSIWSTALGTEDRYDFIKRTFAESR